MNKGEFISAIAEKGEFKKAEAEKFYDAFVTTVVETLKKGDKISLVGFGNFEVKARAEKQGINPATKQAITIAACKVPSFKAGKQFKEEIK